MTAMSCGELDPEVTRPEPRRDGSAPSAGTHLSEFIRSRQYFDWLRSEAPRVAGGLCLPNEVNRLEAAAAERPDLLQAINLRERVLGFFGLYSERQALLIEQRSEAEVKLRDAKINNEHTSQSLRGQVRQFIDLHFLGNYHLRCLEPDLTQIVAFHIEQMEIHNNVTLLLSHPPIGHHIRKSLKGGSPQDLEEEGFRNTFKRLAFNIAALRSNDGPLAISAKDDHSINLPVPLLSPSVYDRAAAVRELLGGTPDHQELQRRVEAFVAAARQQLKEIGKVRHGLYEAVCKEVGVPAV